MNYDISEILKLPPAEQEEIANAIYKHLNNSDEEDKSLEDELDNRFKKIEAGEYTGYSVQEVKEKLAAKWQRK